MPGMQFEYDEKGGTFYYFLISFYALIVIPATYYFWPSSSKNKDKSNENSKRQCRCEGCYRKRHLLKSKNPWSNRKHIFVKLGLLLAWVGFFLLVYKVSQIEMDWTEYDPFQELGVDRGSTTAQIKRAYRKLSLQYHPDMKGGDERRFMRIAKAYAALTDEVARKNWEEHGNPDGPGATQIGIALPKWIVDDKNNIWVLGAYGLVFMIILPLVVGTWWYRTIKFSGDEVLLDTQNLLTYFIHRTPNMAMRRVIMILAGAFEFEKGHNSEIIERESDNEEVPALIKFLPYLNEKNKERPFSCPYSVKARALLHAHFSRLDLNPMTLDRDRQYIVKKCPYLVNEMVNITAMLVAHGHAGRAQNMPRLETMECMMKLSPMLIQALWDGKCQLLQLPHIEEDMLRHFVTRKRNIKTVKQLVQMREDERHSLLRNLTEEQYRDVMNVCSSMPLLDMSVTTEVIDDEDCLIITASSIVTVNVRLVRKSMETILNTEGLEVDNAAGGGDMDTVESSADVETVVDGEEGEGGEGDGAANNSPVKNKPRVWEKQQKKQAKKKGGKGGKKVVVKPLPNSKPAGSARGVEELSVVPSNENSPSQSKAPRTTKEDSGEDSDSEDGGNGNANDEVKDVVAKEEENDGNESEEDEGWKRFQEEVRKENSLDTKERTNHLVHSPYFPADKYEFWWVYLCDRKRHELICAPVQVTSLEDEEEIALKFTAPAKPGQYVYTVCIRSDSYVDMDLSVSLKLDVSEARIIDDHPQWDLSDDEDDEAGKFGQQSDSDRDSGAETDDTDYDYSD